MLMKGTESKINLSGELRIIIIVIIIHMMKMRIIMMRNMRLSIMINPHPFHMMLHMRRMRITMMRTVRMSIIMRKNMRMTMLMNGSEFKINLSCEFSIIIIIIRQRWAQTESGPKSNVGSIKNGPK